VTNISSAQTEARRPQLSDLSDQDQTRTLVSTGQSTRSEMHELGNLIVALQFCLRQLDGRQCTDELEGVVRTGLEVCEGGVAVFRKLHQALREPH
jgi:hypothetical protein